MLCQQYYHNGLKMIWSQRHKCFGSKYIIIKHNTAIITGLNTYNAMHVVVNYITISECQCPCHCYCMLLPQQLYIALEDNSSK